MALWHDHLLPRFTDRAMSMAALNPHRQRACAGLTGRVLEIGFGSGTNVPMYPTGVDRVAAVEPSDVGWRLSEQRRAESAVPIERTGLDGERLTEADASVDSALSTFTLCTIPNPVRALQEVRRTLRPGGTLHFLEHGLAPEPGVARWQRRLEPVQRRLAGGCHLTRDVPALVAEAGFEVVELSEEYLPGPRPSRPWSYLYVGKAVVAGSAPL